MHSLYHQVRVCVHVRAFVRLTEITMQAFIFQTYIILINFIIIKMMHFAGSLPKKCRSVVSDKRPHGYTLSDAT